MNDVNKISFDSLRKQLTVDKQEILQNLWNANSETYKQEWKKEFQESSTYIQMKEKISKANEMEMVHKNEMETIKKNAKIVWLEKKEELRDGHQKEVDKFKEKLSDWNNNIEQSPKFIDLKKKIEQDANSKYSLAYELLQKENDSLKKNLNAEQTRKSNLNSSLIGLDLEQYIENEFRNAFVDAENINFYKATKNISHSKPDYILEIFDDNKEIISKIVIEAKSQSRDGKKKNRNYYDKLSVDQSNHNAEYSLLISELENNSAISIYKVNDIKFKNMYVSRPQFFIPFLKLIISAVKTRKQIYSNIKNIQFEKRQEILDNFDNLKERCILDFVDFFEKDIKIIINLAEKINEQSDLVINKCNTLVNIKMVKAKTKIRKFSIEKIANRIDTL